MILENAAPPWIVLDYENNGEDVDESQEIERRRYPAPTFDFGVIHAAKIAGILIVPMAVVASLFAVYLQGFRADLRLDMAQVVESAIDKHVQAEKATYAIGADVTAMRAELDELKERNKETDRQLKDIDRILTRLVERTGLK